MSLASCYYCTPQLKLVELKGIEPSTFCLQGRPSPVDIQPRKFLVRRAGLEPALPLGTRFTVWRLRHSNHLRTGALGGSRTLNLQLRRLLLYPLSYERNVPGGSRTRQTLTRHRLKVCCLADRPPVRSWLVGHESNVQLVVPKTTGITIIAHLRTWYAQMGSNHRPSPCKSDTLPLSYARTEKFGSRSRDRTSIN